jgi:hypothetical protein
MFHVLKNPVVYRVCGFATQVYRKTVLYNAKFLGSLRGRINHLFPKVEK